jgi:hypothetical protein
MKKSLFVMLVTLMVSVSSYAQFEKGKYYGSALLSGFDMNYTGSEKWKFNLGLRGGYLFEDNWMAVGQVEYGYQKHGPKTISLGAGIRYYVTQNGLFLGMESAYKHRSLDGESVNDFVPSVHVGYAYFISRTVTIEPEFYYNQSFKDHSEYSGAGIRIGIGVYLE